MTDFAVFAGWEEFAIKATLISVFAATLLYMLSKVFQSNQVQQIAKSELVYAASTVFLVIVIIGFMKGLGDDALARVASDMFRNSYNIPASGQLITEGGHQATLIDIVKLYMEPAITCSRNAIGILYKISIPSEAIASVYLEIFMSEHASGFGFKVITERINNATQFLQFFVFMYYLILHTLNFLNHYAPFFIGVGVLLRAFPPTRGAGAYIIAFALGMYIVFPMTYIVGSSLALPAIKAGQVTWTGSFAYEPGKGFTSGATCTLPTLGDKGLKLCGFMSKQKTDEYTKWLNRNKWPITEFLESGLFNIMKHITVTICFLPLVSMVIVMTFVLSTSNLLGGNIPEIGRGLIKFL